MTIEFRTVHTAELCLPPYRNPAGAAHSCRIHHNRIQTDHRLHPVFLRHSAHEFHHGYGTDPYDHLYIFPLIQDAPEDIGHKSMVTIAPIIRRYSEVMACG